MENKNYNDFQLKYQNERVTNEYLNLKMKEMQSVNKFGMKFGSFVDGVIRVKNRKIDAIKNKRTIKKVLQFNKNGINKTEIREKKIIVSLTSYPARLKYVPMVIGSLLRQTVKPDKIILWLGEENPANRNLPSVFDELVKCGLEIKYCPDIRSHKKWYYAFSEFPHDLIITVDDDVIYNDFIVEKLYKAYLDYPDCTPALRVHRMRFDDDCKLLDYNDWICEYHCRRGAASYQFFFTGVGGVLYQPDKLCNEVMNLENIKRYCYTGDDIWLMLMTILSKRKIVMADDVSAVYGISISAAQKTALSKENTIEGGNMKMIEKIIPIYNYFMDEETSLMEMIALDDVSYK